MTGCGSATDTSGAMAVAKEVTGGSVDPWVGAWRVAGRDGGDGDLWEARGWYTHAMQRFTDGCRCTGMKIDFLHTRGNAEAVQTSPLDA